MTLVSSHKLGIGSKGGVVIGHTRTGKPIYESSHARYDRLHRNLSGDIGQDAKAIAGNFRTFSSADHADAASAHFKEAYKEDYGHKDASPIGKAHLRASLAHNRLANAAQKSMPTFTLNKFAPALRAELTEDENMDLEKSGEGSRGGRIIGHTRSGKPVYDGNHANYSSKSLRRSGIQNGKDAAAFVAAKYSDFNAQDHADAARLHEDEKNNGGFGRWKNHDAEKAHYRASMRFDKIHKAEKSMNSADVYKSFLAKGQFQSGNIDNAETVDLDADMTGTSSRGKSTSAPGGFEDQEEEDKKVKKKVDKNSTNGGPGKSVASQVGFEESDAGKLDKLQDCGPYEFGGDVTDDIGEAPTGPLIDGYILRSEQIAEMMKGGAGSRGGRVIGETRSGKAIYANAFASHSHYQGFSHQDHKDAAKEHKRAAEHQRSLGKKEGPHHAAATEHDLKAVGHDQAAHQARKSEDPSEMNKGGAGSRGGRVIGETRSGKAIYANAFASHSHYQGFSRQDHKDAAKEHKRVSEDYRFLGKKDGPHHAAATEHDLKAVGHDRAAYEARKSEDSGDMIKGGEGTRGGKVIGHTRSGKAIYADSFGKVHGFTAADHSDAAAAHKKEASFAGKTATYFSSQKNNKNNRNKTIASQAASIEVHHSKMARLHSAAADDGSAKKSLDPMSKGVAYVGADAKTYQQHIEQRGFVQHATGGMDNYLAQMSKGDTFYANGTNHHNPQDQNHIAQTLCKSCDQQHSSLYGVCPHCGPSMPFGKSMSQSQSHAGWGLVGREAGSALVDMSGFRLND